MGTDYDSDYADYVSTAVYVGATGVKRDRKSTNNVSATRNYNVSHGVRTDSHSLFQRTVVEKGVLCTQGPT